MIRFACKQCGQDHTRPDEAAGTLVFCECGHGNRVPWPGPDAVPTEPAEREEKPQEPAADRPLPRGRRKQEPRPRDPSRCLNHADVAAELTCDGCGEHFCAGCVVRLQERTLCGPCKNHFLRGLDRPPRPSTLGVLALVLGLLGGPIGFCATIMPVSQDAAPAVVVVAGVASLFLPVLALVLAGLALREMELNPGVGGRGFAMAGMAAALVGAVWSLTVIMLMAMHQLEV